MSRVVSSPTARQNPVDHRQWRLARRCPGGTIPGDDPPADPGQSVLRFDVQPKGTLEAVHFFAAYDAPALDTNGLDFGTGGPARRALRDAVCLAVAVAVAVGQGGPRLPAQPGRPRGWGEGPRHRWGRRSLRPQRRGLVEPGSVAGRRRSGSRYRPLRADQRRGVRLATSTPPSTPRADRALLPSAWPAIRPMHSASARVPRRPRTERRRPRPACGRWVTGRHPGEGSFSPTTRLRWTASSRRSGAPWWARRPSSPPGRGRPPRHRHPARARGSVSGRRYRPRSPPLPHVRHHGRRPVLDREPDGHRQQRHRHNRADHVGRSLHRRQSNPRPAGHAQRGEHAHLTHQLQPHRGVGWPGPA
jgi:hypothetical protein